MTVSLPVRLLFALGAPTGHACDLGLRALWRDGHELAGVDAHTMRRVRLRCWSKVNVLLGSFLIEGQLLQLGQHGPIFLVPDDVGAAASRHVAKLGLNLR